MSSYRSVINAINTVNAINTADLRRMHARGVLDG